MDEEANGAKVAVLVPTAGRGARMGGRRKQYRRLGEHPLFVQTLRIFDRHPAIDEIVVAAPPEAQDELIEMLQEARLQKVQAVVEGGAARQASVRAALQAISDDIGLVLVHDAVRPFVRAEDVQAVVATAREAGAAALAVPVSDTVRRSADEGKRFGETVPREELYRMQTPQGFRRTWLEAAHEAARGDASATDDVELVQRVDYPVRIVSGDARNFKITTPGDWELAQLLWPHWKDGSQKK